MAEQDLRNTSFYKALLQIAKEQGVVTLLDIVSEMKKHKDAPSDLDAVVDVGRQIGVRPARKILAFDFEQRCAHFDLDGAAEVLADDLDRIFHRDMRIQNFNQR